MKKLFSTVLAILLVLSFTGCKTVETPEPKVTPETETYSLSVIIESDDGVQTSHSFDYESDSEESLLEIIEEDLNVTYTVGGSGSFITGIEDIQSQYGSFIAIYQNEEMSQVGIDLIEIEDGDVFTFQLTWWDSKAKAVYDAIELFLENHANNYVNSEMIDYNVISALALLGVVDEYITQEEVQTYFSGATPDSVASYFKTIITYSAVGLDSIELVEELDLMYTTGAYGQTAYGVLGVHSLLDYDTTNIDVLADSYFTTSTPFSVGLDTGGISLVALSTFVDNTDSRVEEFLEWIKTDQLDTGGIKTRDSVWGDTTYPGTENAASMSQVILGMISLNVNPASTDYTIDGNNLITRLLEFQTDTGSFEWTLGTGEDLMFSTPQSFLALVSYYIHINEYRAVNPYNFN